MTFDFKGWTLVFDLDGTLVETAPDLNAALNHTLSLKGLGPVPLPVIRDMIGDGAMALIRKGHAWHGQDVDESELPRLWQSFIDFYIAHICDTSHLYEGAREALNMLQTTGAVLAVCTNKTQDLAERVLTGLGIANMFTVIVGADAVPSKKPDGDHILRTVERAHGDPAKAIMIGDSATDERAARNAGLPFVFVTFGYGQMADEPYRRSILIDHWSHMITALSTLAANKS